MRTNIMLKETRATLEIIIREIQDILNDSSLTALKKTREVKGLLDKWVHANNLHPEMVKKTMVGGVYSRFEEL